MTFHTSSPAASALLSTRSRRSLAALALTALLGVPGLALAQQAAGTTGQVFTADELGNSVSRVDLATGEVTTVPLPVTPHNVQATPDMDKLLIVGSPVEAGHGAGGGHGDAANAGRLLVLDQLVLDAAPVEIEIGTHPAHVVTDREGGRAFATNAGDDTISVVDLASRTVTSIPAGDYPHGLRLSPDGRHLLVANVEGGSVSLFDTGTLAEVARIPVGAAPVQVAFLPDGSRAYVSLRDEDAVAVIDLATREVTARIPVGDGPIQLYATPDGGKVFVANQGSEAAPSNEVSVIDVASGSVVATVKAGMGAHGVSVSTDGTLAFVTNVNDGTLSVIDTASNEVVATHTVGAGPNGVTYLAR